MAGGGGGYYRVEVTGACGHRVVGDGSGAYSQERADEAGRAGSCSACRAWAVVRASWERGEWNEGELAEWVGALAAESSLAGDDRLAQLIEAGERIR